MIVSFVTVDLLLVIDSWQCESQFTIVGKIFNTSNMEIQLNNE